MSKITVDRAVLEQARKALSDAQKDVADFQHINTDETDAAIDALCEALAQPQPEPVAVVVAREYDDGSFAGHHLEWRGRNEADDFPAGTYLYTSPPASTTTSEDARLAHKPLTVERIKDEASHCGFIGSVEKLVEFVRRIEAAAL